MSWDIIQHLCVPGKLSHAQISPFTTIANYCASLQPPQCTIEKAAHCHVAVWFPRIFPPPPPPPPHATSWFLIIRRQGNGPLHRITGWFLEEANFSLLYSRDGLCWKHVLETAHWYRDGIKENLLHFLQSAFIMSTSCSVTLECLPKSWVAHWGSRKGDQVEVDPWSCGACMLLLNLIIKSVLWDQPVEQVHCTHLLVPWHPSHLDGWSPY